MMIRSKKAQQYAENGDSGLSEITIAIDSQPSCHTIESGMYKRIETLLEQSRDEELAAMINQTLFSGTANVIRRVAERSSECIQFLLNGVEAKALLFTLPILVEFDKDVPGSLVESALHDIQWSRRSAESLGDDVLNLQRTKILPTLFKFNDLTSIPLSLVRKGIIALATTGNGGPTCSHPFVGKNTTLRRCKTFLRYLVGWHILYDQHMNDDVGKNLCTCIERITHGVLTHCMKLNCSVNVFYTGTFHEPLYTSMWLYQIRRLNQIASAIRSEKVNGDSSKVVISQHGDRCNFDLKVAFYKGCNLLDERKYLLHARPAENSNRCTTRIMSQMEAIGMMVTYKEKAASQIAQLMMLNESEHRYADIASIPI